MVKTKMTRGILLASAVFLLLLVVCCALWKPVLLPALQSADWGESYVLPPTKVSLDLATLPAEPTEEDYARVATQLLEHESDRPGFYPTFVMWTIPCGPDIYPPDEVHVSASRYTAVGSFRRYLSGRVDLWPQHGEAEIEIWDGGKRSSEYPPTPGLNFDELKWHVDDVLLVAEGQGGYEFRQATRNQCEVVLRLSSTVPTWLVEYRPLRGTDYFCMTMERETGIYTATLSTTACKW